MIEIIPNWHPMSVHFPIALVTVSTILFIVGIIFSRYISDEIFIVSKWCIWIAGLSSIIVAILGWLAYNSVAHDAPSHAAMTLHRNWAIPTAIFIIGSAIFSYIIRHNWGKKNRLITIIVLLCAMGLTSITGWLGAEAVYRYGIGVMRIPDSDNHGHAESNAQNSSELSSSVTNNKDHGNEYQH